MSPPRGNVRLIQGKDFIRAADLGEVAILLDVRRTQGRLTPNELWTLAQEVLKHKRAFANRTAIVCQFERKERAQFFAHCAEQGGVNIEVFTSYEEAMDWLLA